MPKMTPPRASVDSPQPPVAAGPPAGRRLDAATPSAVVTAALVATCSDRQRWVEKVQRAGARPALASSPSPSPFSTPDRSWLTSACRAHPDDPRRARAPARNPVADLAAHATARPKAFSTGMYSTRAKTAAAAAAAIAQTAAAETAAVDQTTKKVKAKQSPPKAKAAQSSSKPKRGSKKGKAPAKNSPLQPVGDETDDGLHRTDEE
ncbi:hypothetical protein RHS01_07710 [Rhizoctonia solani]|uniref:Uncharacterized protein n=1 Tax=Rhizoctonia solani TaxID=456999 RepID=A0A8H7IAP5_9AGAM|nr:hypothetical protein RHS01_07710 [Rhizoctonia solani]